MKKPDLRKYLALIAFWASSMLIIVGGSIYYKMHQGAEYDQNAVPYINEIVPIISQWDPATTKALMVPEIAAKIPEEKFARGMDFFSQLGTLQELDKPSFVKAFENEETDIGKQTIIEYDVDAVYQNGEAEVNLKLMKQGDSYQVFRFNFSSETLMQGAPGHQ